VAFRSFLIAQAGVPELYVEAAMEQLLDDARIAGFIRVVKGAEWIDLQNASLAPVAQADDEDESVADNDGLSLDDVDEQGPTGGAIVQSALQEEAQRRAQRPSGIFLGHGKNRKPLEQLTKILSEYKIPYKVAVDEANRGRPISQKVAEVMDECGAAILIFTADRELKDVDGNTIWQPSENVVFELGAAAVKYGSRIVIFKEESVDFPTNFRDIGYISFARDQLDAKAVDLIRELIGFGLLQLTVATA
jgi:predicted nucleotide-binding protein with TIR-like domain